ERGVRRIQRDLRTCRALQRTVAERARSDAFERLENRGVVRNHEIDVALNRFVEYRLRQIDREERSSHARCCARCESIAERLEQESDVVPGFRVRERRRELET